MNQLAICLSLLLLPFRRSNFGIIISISSPPAHAPLRGVQMTVSSSNIVEAAGVEGIDSSEETKKTRRIDSEEHYPSNILRRPLASSHMT